MRHLIWIGLMLSFLASAERPKGQRQEGPRPTREISLIVTKEGYYPKTITVFEGEKVKFYATSTVEEPHCVIVESHKVFMAANKGKISEAEAVFDTPGEFAFYCPSSKSDGKIVVLKKAVPKRDVASEKKADDPSVWVPREY